MDKEKEEAVVETTESTEETNTEAVEDTASISEDRVKAVEEIMGKVDEDGNPLPEETKEEDIVEAKEENPEDDKKEESKAVVFDESLLSRAELYGLSKSDVREFESPKALNAALNVMERQRHLAKEEPSKKVEEELPDIDLDKLTADDLSEDKILETFKAVKASFDRKNEKLQKELTELKSSKARDIQETLVSEFDELASNAGEEFAPILGKGSRDSGLTESQYKERQKIWRRVTALGQLAHDEGENLSLEELFKQAIAVTHPKIVASKGEKSLKEDINKRKSLAINPPSTVKKTAEQDRIEKVQQILNGK